MSSVDHVQTVIIGAGVVGLAIARKLARRGHEVIILEEEPLIGQHTSSHNSEVIHAGMYYPENSLRARFCVKGREMMYDYCKTRHINHQAIGKLIVATQDDQINRIHELESLGQKNGINDLKKLSATEAKELEPELTCKKALLSPSTGIVDASHLMLSLLGEAEAEGAVLACNTRLKFTEIKDSKFFLYMADDETVISCTNLINAAGLGAWDVARNMQHYPEQKIPTQNMTKGNYFVLQGAKPPFTRLIYPVPYDKSLGVHYLRDLGGQVKFGPDVEQLKEQQIDYKVDPARKASFEQKIRLFWPELPDNALVPDMCGIRPRISAPEEKMADFLIEAEADHGIKGLVQLFGIESPGLTSSLAIAEYVGSLYE